MAVLGARDGRNDPDPNPLLMPDTDEGQSAVMVSLNPPTVRYEPLKEAVKRMKTVPLDSDTVETARDIGISFGD